MNPRELRIGNLLQDCVSKVPYEVTHNTFSSLVAYIEEEKEAPVEPIPLTEEWLLKFGFIFSHSRGFEEYYDKNDVGLTVIESGTPDIKILYRSTQLKYVHQLQNLYYTISGEELEVK